MPYSLPWLWRKPSSTVYSSLKQEEEGSGLGDGTRSETTIVVTKRRPQKNFIISLIVNGALLALLVVVYTGRWRWAQPKSKKLLPTPVPEFPNYVHTFKLDPLFLSLPSEESNAAWEGLQGPNSHGFINLEPSREFDFPDRIAGLSAFHQLHCLKALRNFMWDLMYDRVDTKALLQTWPKNVTTPNYEQAINGIWHFAHCFDYLRQGIQCSADLSLEFVSENTGGAVVDGLDYPHECKNWDDIWAYATELA